MILLSQRNPRWSMIKLSPSFLTVGRYGCTTTCICMLSDYFKCFTLPSVAVGHHIKYTQEGMIIWQSIDFPGFKFDRRIREFNEKEILASLTRRDGAAILAIDKDSHWVVAIRKLIGDWYVVADPWDGRRRLLNRKRISGSAHFLSK